MGLWVMSLIGLPFSLLVIVNSLGEPEAGIRTTGLSAELDMEPVSGFGGHHIDTIKSSESS